MEAEREEKGEQGRLRGCGEKVTLEPWTDTAWRGHRRGQEGGGGTDRMRQS